MIEVKNLSKHYGDKKAVNDISFTVDGGEILGFLGPNGAGKSTTMNMLTGYISSTEGSALINGVDILENPIKAKSFIGYLPEQPPLYLDMTVDGYLNFIYDLKKCKMPRKAHLEDVCKLTRLGEVRGRIIKHLSKGYKQRVGIAQALINNPPVLILDEPTVGLDPKQIIEIRTLIKKLGKSHTVILSSHILSEVQAVCDRIIIINKGTIAADDTTDNLTKKISDDHRLIMRIAGPKSEIIDIFKSFSEVKYARADIEREPGVFEYEIETEDNTDIRRELNKKLAEKEFPIYMMKTAELTLEDIFLKITMGSDTLIEQKDKNQKNITKNQKIKDAKKQEVLNNIGLSLEKEKLMRKPKASDDKENKKPDSKKDEPEKKASETAKKNGSDKKTSKNGGNK